MTRKGFIDGRSLRLPTVTVRPGRPNKAASSFASGIVREPLSGVEAICPVTADQDVGAVAARRDRQPDRGHEAPASSFAHTRSINVPGISVAVKEMVDALREVAGDEVAARVRWQLRPRDRPHRVDVAVELRAEAAGARMRADSDFASIVRAYIADDMPRT